MSNILRPYTGTVYPTFTSLASGTELSTVGSLYGVLCGVLVDNTGATNASDDFGDFSFSGTGTTPASGTSSLAVLCYPLNQDGTTYGPSDMTAGSAAAALTPNLLYQRGTIGLKYNASSATVVGQCTIEMPFQKFYVGLYNPLANAFTSGTLKLKTWSYTNNG
jgi:hypothetical protein